jgi:hypothetical protein
MHIAAPLLLNRRKFHIRAYAVACNPACAFTYHQDCHSCVLGRGTERTKKYRTAHITNTAYQDLDPKFREDKCVLWGTEDIAQFW